MVVVVVVVGRWVGVFRVVKVPDADLTLVGTASEKL